MCVSRHTIYSPGVDDRCLGWKVRALDCFCAILFINLKFFTLQNGGKSPSRPQEQTYSSIMYLNVYLRNISLLVAVPVA